MGKNLSLNVKEMEQYLWDTEEIRMHDTVGIRYIFRFPNDYGASVVKAFGTDGYKKDLWELAVLLFEFPDEYSIVYPKEIVEYGMTKGCMTEDDIYKDLKTIKEVL